MESVRGKRVEHEYVQVNEAPRERVFPLLCPVREAEWVPGWKYRLVYSESGVAELGCVFTTPSGDGKEVTWVVTAYEPAEYRVEFTWVWAGMVATRLRIRLEADGERTRAHIAYSYTGLSEAGNAEVARYDRAWFETKMRGWEKAINAYLTTGKEAEVQWE